MRRVIPVMTLVAATLLGGAQPPSSAVASSLAHTPAPGFAAPRAEAERIRALPPAPAAMMTTPSIPALMDAEHAADEIAFTPGMAPSVPRAPFGAALGGQAETASARPLGLVNPELGAAADLTALPNGLRKEVLGFLPYWMLDASDLQWMQYQLVSTIAYFGVAARSDGTLATYSTGWSGWNSSAMTGVINAAHARGVKVVLTVTMMAYDGGAQQAALLGSATNRANLINAIVAAVRSRNADGVNLDFEPVAVAQRDQYTSFVRQLKAGLVSAGVGSHLTVCTMAGAATWATGYDLAALVAPGAADALFVMGYDFSWTGSARAGGVAPMESPYILDVNQSIADYLRVVPPSRIIWGVPYYGRTWRTQSSALNALTQPGAASTSAAYYYPANLSLATRYGRLWDSTGRVPWFRYYDTPAASWIQGYYDDAASLAVKWDMVNQRGLAGTGMWALLMDAGQQDLWNLLANKFMTDATPPVGGIVSLPPVTDASAIPVSWRATDVGSGVLNYSVQVRDRAGGTWTNWLTNTTSTSGHWLGQPRHAYDFRVSAVDRKGNRQPWVGSPSDPGSTLVVGGFATVTADTLSVRDGAGTSFRVQHTLTDGDRVFLMGGPIASGGYNWYQVQFGFSEWPSADYPRVGWAAAGSGSVPYLVPAVAPSVTTLSPAITEITVSPRRFSPNGDGVLDAIQLSFRLVADADAARLDVLDTSGSVVAGGSLGRLAAGPQVVTWDGRRSDGSWAPAGAYLPRITVTDAAGTHVGPTAGVDATVLTTWGVTADLAPPIVAASSPSGTLSAPTATISATFSEPIVGGGPHLRLVDAVSGAPVSALASYDSTSRRASLDPVASLEAGHTYRVSVDPALRDEAGNRVSSVGWEFTTAPHGVTGFDPPAVLTFAAGSHTGYRFDSAGQVTATRVSTLGSISSAATSQRSTVVPGQTGAWLLVTNGVWAGYWIPESTRAYIAGELDRTDFAPARSVSFAAGSHTGYRFTASGAVSGTRTATLSSRSSAPSSARAVINGRPYLLITAGVWAGYWVAESSAVTLAGPPPPPIVVLATYSPPQTLNFAAGTYVGRTFDAYGTQTASKSYTLTVASGAPTSQKVTIPNQSGNWYLITAGVWAGYWIQESAATTMGGP